MSLTQRIPELEASSKATGAPETPAEEPGKDTPPPKQQPSEKRSWLHRFFFGE